MKQRAPHIPDVLRSLSLYRLSGAAAMASFAACVFLLVQVMRSEELNVVLLGMSLLAGFLWIGCTSVCRHSLLRIRDDVGRRTGMLEFLSTQFVFLSFPYVYPKVKKEVYRYTGRH